MIVTPRSKANRIAGPADDEEVLARGLDPAHWWVHKYDIETGEYEIVRNVPLAPKVVADDSSADPMKDALLDSYLASLDETVRDAVGKARVGQGLFRDRLLERWGNACAVTGVKGSDFLVASHIRRWSECGTAYDRLSASNGLLLVPNLDKLFDQHWISFDERFSST